MAQSIIKNTRTTSIGGATSIVQAVTADGLVAGQWEVTASFYFAGTAPVDGTDSDNVIVAVDNVNTAKLAIPAAAGVLQTYRFMVQTNGTKIALVSGGAGTVGTIYDATIIATQVGLGSA